MKAVFPDSDDLPGAMAASDLSLLKIARVVWQMVKPYRKWLLIIFGAMLVETGASLATPWPLKIIIDNVIGHRKLPQWLSWMDDIFHRENKIQFAAVAAITVVLLAAIGSLATFIDNYFTESVAQYLRRRIYHHLQRLSLSYYDTHQTGKLLSTLTSDVSTIQDFASSTLMNIIVDNLTIVGMLGIMFYLSPWFTMVAVVVTPFLLFFVGRFKKMMKKATREVRLNQGNMLAILQHGLESIRAVNAFGRQQLEEDRLKKISLETVGAALKARKVKSVISPIVSITVAGCTALVIWQGADMVFKHVMTVGTLTVFLWYMNKFFSPVQDLAKMTSTIAQATVAFERIRAILDTEIIVGEKPDAVEPERFNGDIVFDNVSFSYVPDTALFYGSVLENIAYGRPEASREEVIDAANLANAHEFISRMPHGYDTLVGERGLTLSGGQRQRIGIARAVVRNSPILLLDEPTAALDPEAENIVMDALTKLMEGRTVVTIAHRLGTISNSDNIIVLRNGAVFEHGTHEELMALGGVYARSYKIQSEARHEDHRVTL